MIRYIDGHRERFGVEPICDVLQVAPSTSYSSKKRPPCRRRITDESVKSHIRRVFEDNYAVYGARKVWRQLNREGVVVARCTVERLMRQMGLAGRVRGKRRRTTIRADSRLSRADECDAVAVWRPRRAGVRSRRGAKRSVGASRSPSPPSSGAREVLAPGQVATPTRTHFLGRHDGEEARVEERRLLDPPGAPIHRWPARGWRVPRSRRPPSARSRAAVDGGARLCH